MPCQLPPRKTSHIRRVTYQGYEREDGLWDMEAECTTARHTTCLRFATRAFGWRGPHPPHVAAGDD